MKLNRRQLRTLIESVINEGFEPGDYSTGNYKVKKGDTLSSIAQKECPKGCSSKHLKDLNKDKIKDANMIKTGQNIKIYIPIEKEDDQSPPTPPMKK
jgi:LysM repeat protein